MVMGEQATIPDIEDLWRKSEEILQSALEEARRRPVYLEADDITMEDFDLKEGWMIKLTPPEVEGGDVIESLITPGGKEVSLSDVYVTKAGDWITADELGAVSPRVSPVPVTPEELVYLSRDEELIYKDYQRTGGGLELDIWRMVGSPIRPGEEDLDRFLEELQRAGRTPEIENSLRGIFPEITEEQLAELFIPRVEISAINETAPNLSELWERAMPGLKIDKFLDIGRSKPEDLFNIITNHGVSIGRTYASKELIKALWPDIDIEKIFPEMPETIELAGDYLAQSWEELKKYPTSFEWKKMGEVAKGALGVVGAWFDKYLGRPWETAMLEARSRFQLATGMGSDLDRITIERLKSTRDKYGWAAALISQDVSEIWHDYLSETQGPAYYALGISEWLNPAYLIPIGGVFGKASKFTSKIPLIGKGMRYTAAGVNYLDRGITYPIAKPLEMAVKYGAKGAERVGVRIGEATANRIIKESKNLEALIDLPASEDILKGCLVDNWMRKTLEIASKVPPLRAGIEKGLGWRILIKRESQLVEDIVGRGAVVHAEIMKRGINAKAPKIWELRDISQDPVKLFGFNKQAYSKRMADNLLPEYAAEREFAGTLEHVFTKPEMYKLTSKQIDYVTKVHEINTEILNLLKKEGVAPENVTQDWWIHRVVEGKFDPEGELIAVRGRPGVRAGRRVGTKPSYEMHRKAPTMAEGIAWGIQYNKNPELAISTYIEEAYKKIADERFIKYVEPFGVLPSERLAERFPEVAERALLTKTELADAARFHGVINRAIRGEKLPEQTIRAMERRFPEMGKRLRALVKGEKLSPIDEAAIKAESMEKDMFGYPVEDFEAALREVPVEPKVVDLSEWFKLGGRPSYYKNLRISEGIKKVEDELSSLRGLKSRTLEQQARVENLLSDLDILKGYLSKYESQIPKALKPKVEGIKGLEKETSFKDISIKPTTGIRQSLFKLRKEIMALKEARKAPYWQARTERAMRMEQVRQPEIGEGYLPQPFAGGRIYEQEFIDSFNKFFGQSAGHKSLTYVSDVASILRITKAAMDFSAPAIQGLPSWGLAHAYLMFNPPIGLRMVGAWYKAFLYHIGVFFDPGILAKYVTKNNSSIMQRLRLGGSMRSIDWINVSELRGGIGGLFERATRKIPLTPYQRFEASWLSMGEMIRDDFFKILSPKAIAKGKEYELARSLDLLTGITDARTLGVPATVRQLEQSFVWFAPNYTRACLTIIADIFRGGYTGHLARNAIGGMITAGACYYTAVQYGMSTIQGKSHEKALEDVKEGFCIYEDPITDEVEWKPSARFMTIKVGNYNMGFGGFWYGLLRLAGNISACVNEVGEKEKIDLIRILKHGSLNRLDNPFIYWWFTRASPLVGTGFELSTGRDFLGYPLETPLDYLRYIATRFEPIWAEQGINWMIPGMARDNEIPEDEARAAVIPAEIFGLRTFPESQWVSFYDKVNEYIQRIPEEELDEKQIDAWREGKLEWRHLTEIQQNNLLSKYPELRELYGEAQADSAVRNLPHWKVWQDRMDEERQIYYKRIEELTQQLLRGEIDTREYREKAGEAGQNYGSILEAIERDPNYDTIYDFFNTKEAEGDKYGFLDDLMLAEYQANILYAEDLVDSKGDYDWDERDRRIDAFIERWGQDGYDRVQNYIQEAKRLKGVSDVWIRKSSDTEKLGRGYWRLPYKPIIEMDEEDEAKGNIPAEYYALWKQYQDLLKPKEISSDDIDEAIKHIELARSSHYPAEGISIDEWNQKWINNYTFILEVLNNIYVASDSDIRKAIDILEEDIKFDTPKGGWESVSEEQKRLSFHYKMVLGYEKVLNLLKDVLPSDENIEEFIKNHPELAMDFRAEYRKEQPEEDAMLALWGYGGKLQSMEAYNLVTQWGKELGIPLEQMGLGLPPRSLIQNYFDYSDVISHFSGNSSEAKLYRLENHEWDAWGQENWGWSEVEDKIEVLRINVQYREQDREYDDIKMDDSTLQREAREKYLEDNPEYAKARRRRDAYKLEVPEEHIDNYIEYYSLPQAGYSQERFLKEHRDYYDEVYIGILGRDKIDFDKVPTEKWENTYNNEYLKLAKGRERYEFRGDNPWFDEEGVKLGKWKPYDPSKYRTTPWMELEEQGLLEEYRKIFK